MENYELPVDYAPPQFIWRMNEALEALHDILEAIEHIEEHVCESCT